MRCALREEARLPARGRAVNRRTRMLVLLVVCMSVLASAGLWLQAERSRVLLRDQLLQEAEQRSLHLADAMSGQVGVLISMLDLELVDLRREWQREPVLFDPIARTVISVLPEGFVTHVSIADADGRMLYDTLPGEQSTSVADRDHFLAQKALAGEGKDQLLIGKPVRSRMVDGWVFMLNRPLLVDGAFAGVIQMAVSSDHMARKLAALQLSENDVVTLVHPDGGILARSRGSIESSGHTLPPDRPFLVDREQTSGLFKRGGMLDGIPRTYGWHRVLPHGLVLVIGLADDSVLAPLAPALERIRWVAGLLSGLVLLSGGFISALLLRVGHSHSQLVAQEGFRQRLFESSLVPIVVMDADTTIVVDCNLAAARIYGFPSRESVKNGKPLMFSAPVQYDGTPSRDKAPQYIRQAIEQGSVVFEWLHQRPDGTQWDAEVRLMSFESEGRWLLQFTLQDITDRRSTQAALEDSEARLKEAQRLAHVGGWELNPANRKILWSDETYRIFEVDPATFEVTYDSFMAFVHPDDRDLVNQAYRESVKRRTHYDFVHRLLMPDGRIKHVRERGVSEFDGDRLVRSVGTVQDITEMREAEDKLKRLNEELEKRVADRTREMTALNRDLEAFAYSVSHDLRTPLRSLDGYASLLEAEYGERLDDDGRGYLERIRQSARRMSNLINDMLTMAHLNRADLRRERLDLSELARSVVADITAAEPGRSAQWHIEDGLVVQADPTLLHAVLQNLLGNAWKYTSKMPQARISFTAERCADGSTEFQVRDNGAGFDMAYGHHLFQPFKRLHAQHEFEGTGVGLATVQRIIERHGGRVRGEGAVGQGALFAFTLPQGP